VFVSAQLIFDNGFRTTDAGDYACMVPNTGASYTSVFVLEIGQPKISASPCSTYSTAFIFQLRILDAHCEEWTSSSLMQIVVPQFQRSLMGILAVLCRTCSGDFSGFTVVNATCSSEKHGAFLFKGSVMESPQSNKVLCTLNMWHQTAPVVAISNNLYAVDQNCILRTYLVSTECRNETLSPANDLVIIISSTLSGTALVSAGLVVLVVTLLMFLRSVT
jgi:hypothetical protein